ncbi:hypothetical protein NBRC3257_0754 [Gluconobacter thailandicus NBRC 3257]|uniref:Uncharacterized protein n=2 Tax=Gluconobacter thailandicus TaxID=257438 RepID=A0ABQ0IUA8_GLUTH|nr:hypothetical protein AD946_09235 [Gluconobacter thailandicus]GAC88078.1 hypothetical protein NBRC3255_1739 [Gluconobacter thailandicus NBRC 3255]GAD25755.1 hypothetical protein NBRC3257_0754 [Gluconobacter thailandicus NBRC 3257]
MHHRHLLDDTPTRPETAFFARRFYMERRRTMTRYLVILAYLAGLALGSANAATRDEQKQACQGDAIRLCTFAIPNEAKITACMKKKLDQLSPKCRAMFEPLPKKSDTVSKPKE